MSSLGVEPAVGDCRYCGNSFQIHYLGTPIVAGECTRCYIDRSRGRNYVERMVRSATRRAKAHKAVGNIPKARRAVKEARRLMAIFKVCKDG